MESGKYKRYKKDKKYQRHIDKANRFGKVPVLSEYLKNKFR